MPPRLVRLLHRSRGGGGTSEEDAMGTPAPVDPERLRQVAELVQLVTGTPAALVRPEHRFVDDLRVDSLSMLEVLEGCEQRLGVPVPDAVVRQLVHVGDLVDWLAHHDRRTPGG